MPGMMDTVLNLGLNDETVEGLAQGTGNPRFAYDSYRRFIAMFGDVVMGVDPQLFEDALTAKKEEVGAELDTDLSAEDLKDLTVRFKKILRREGRRAVPGRSPASSCTWPIVAVFESWDNHRAKVYRRTKGIPDDLGTAVNVQTMVFGNKGETSGTGVAFTRDPSTGENMFYGEFLMNAQGEDVVAGVRVPAAARGAARGHAGRARTALRHPRDAREALPRHAGRGVHHRGRQALHAADPQRQADRPGGSAAWRWTWWTKASSPRTRRSCASTPAQLDQLLHPRLDPKAKLRRADHRPGRFAGRRGGPGGLRRRRGRGARLRRASRSSSCVGRPTPTTSTGLSRPRASSPATAA